MTFQNSANRLQICCLKFPRRRAIDKATVVRKTKQSRNSAFKGPKLFVVLLFKMCYSFYIIVLGILHTQY